MSHPGKLKDVPVPESRKTVESPQQTSTAPTEHRLQIDRKATSSSLKPKPQVTLDVIKLSVSPNDPSKVTVNSPFKLASSNRERLNSFDNVNSTASSDKNQGHSQIQGQGQSQGQGQHDNQWALFPQTLIVRSLAPKPKEESTLKTSNYHKASKSDKGQPVDPTTSKAAIMSDSSSSKTPKSLAQLQKSTNWSEYVLQKQASNYGGSNRNIVEKLSMQLKGESLGQIPTFDTSLGFDREIWIVAKAIREGHVLQIKGPVTNDVREVQRVEKAIREGKVFEMRGRVNPTAREVLQQRGWLEKIGVQNPNPKQGPLPTKTRSTFDPFRNDSVDLSHLPFPQRLLNGHPANLIWVDLPSRVNWNDAYEWQMINKHPMDWFTLKKNMMQPIQNIHWYASSSAQAFPRSYRLYLDEEKEAFVHDMKLTSVMSLLKWFVNSVEMSPLPKSPSPSTSESLNQEVKLLLHLVDFAIVQVTNYIRIRRHDDLDAPANANASDPISFPKHRKDSSTFTAKTMDWDKFLNQVTSFTHRRNKLLVGTIGEEDFMAKAVKVKQDQITVTLTDVQHFWPQFHIDGVRNSNGIMGQGIIILDTYEAILKGFLSVDTTKSLWICQKYIERPLLIYKTKFDIRQWFLISNYNPLTVWFYSLEKLDESIHLTNNAVQVRYNVDPSRDFALPSDNMWSNAQFQEYLKKVGQPTVWKDVIYPGMKETIVDLLLSARERIVDRDKSFQIMGADFMISDDFKPWFIEVNSSPVLANTTSVTSKLCPRVIEDAIRVALDWKAAGNAKAKTGDFELLYQEKEKLPSQMPLDGSTNIWLRGVKFDPLNDPNIITPNLQVDI